MTGTGEPKRSSIMKRLRVRLWSQTVKGGISKPCPLLHNLSRWLNLSVPLFLHLHNGDKQSHWVVVRIKWLDTWSAQNSADRQHCQWTSFSCYSVAARPQEWCRIPTEWNEMKIASMAGWGSSFCLWMKAIDFIHALLLLSRFSGVWLCAIP